MSIGRKDSLPHIVEFDGLRGYLAWWVVLFHMHMQSGLSLLNVKPLVLTIGQGFLAVPLFFALSGFVIAYLEDVRREPYWAFLTRRFFRLAPVYFLVLILGTFDAIRAKTYGDTLGSHILVRIPMLHGVIPMRLLPGASNSLVFVAWSVSVEWQFYLIAPFVITAIRTSAARAVALLLTFWVIAYLVNKIPALSFGDQATVFHQAGAFALGIGSFYLFKFATTHVEMVRTSIPYLLPFGLAIIWTCGGLLIYTGPIWIVLFSAVLAHYCGAETFVTRPFRRVLRAPVMVWLGRLSYCTYLCHSGLIEFVDGTAARWGVQSPWARFAILIAVACPLVALVSEIIHRLVEKPGIQMGKRIVGWFDGAPPTPSPMPATADSAPISLASINSGEVGGN